MGTEFEFCSETHNLRKPRGVLHIQMSMNLYFLEAFALCFFSPTFHSCRGEKPGENTSQYTKSTIIRMSSQLESRSPKACLTDRMAKRQHRHDAAWHTRQFLTAKAHGKDGVPKPAKERSPTAFFSSRQERRLEWTDNRWKSSTKKTSNRERRGSSTSTNSTEMDARLNEKILTLRSLGAEESLLLKQKDVERKKLAGVVQVLATRAGDDPQALAAVVHAEALLAGCLDGGSGRDEGLNENCMNNDDWSDGDHD